MATSQLSVIERASALSAALPWLDREMKRYPLHPAVLRALNKYDVADIDELATQWPHLAADGERLAYTQSWAKGERDIQTATTPGKYLRRHFPAMKDHELRDLVAMGTEEGFSIHRTMDEILHVIRNGPSSCMKFGEGELDGDHDGHHPYEVYEPEFGWGIAAYRNEDGRIDGRAIVLDDSRYGKCFVRTYRRCFDDNGREEYSQSHEGLNAWLESQGYTKRSGWPVGARLLRIEVDGGDRLLCPYLDGNIDSVEDQGDCLRISTDGYAADSSEGLIELQSMETCSCCDGRFHRDDMCSVGHHGDRQVCDDCRDRHYTYVKGFDGDWYYVPDDQAVNATDGNCYDRDALDRYEIVETEEGEYRPESECVYVEGDGWYYQFSDEIVKTADDEWELKSNCYCCDHDGEWYFDDGRSVNIGAYQLHPDNVEDFLLEDTRMVAYAIDHKAEIPETVIEQYFDVNPDFALHTWPNHDLARAMKPPVPPAPPVLPPLPRTYKPTPTKISAAVGCLLESSAC